jgi:flagellar L-ring protein precursor FlgH
MIYSTTNKTIITIMAVALAGWAMRYTAAQSSSLYGRFTADGAYITLNDLPSHYRDLPQALRLRINDLVTIRVDIRSVTSSEGEAQRRRNLLYDAVLRDWVVLKGIDEVKPSGQSGGNPRLQGQINGLFRAEGELDTTESVQFNITATIADIRPNGTLVLEAHKTVQVNDMSWDYSLSGICRKEDLGPDNVIFSEKIAELSVYKRERGQVRDAYKRGWLLSWWDSVRLF